MHLKSLTDPQLLLLFVHGEESAFALLFERHIDAVYRLCVRMLGEHGDAEEAAQEVFFKVAESAHSYTPDAAFSTWLHCIAVRLCLNLLRARRAKKRATTNTIPFPQTSAPTAPEVLNAYTTAQRLQDALDTLEPHLKAAFVLGVLEGLSNADVAARLNLPTNTAKTHIHRARRTLRDALQNPQPSLIRGIS